MTNSNSQSCLKNGINNKVSLLCVFFLLLCEKKTTLLVAVMRHAIHEKEKLLRKWKKRKLEEKCCMQLIYDLVCLHFFHTRVQSCTGHLFKQMNYGRGC